MKAGASKLITVELGDFTERLTMETLVASEAIMRAAMKLLWHGDRVVREQTDAAAKLIGAVGIAHQNVVCTNVRLALAERAAQLTHLATPLCLLPTIPR